MADLNVTWQSALADLGTVSPSGDPTLEIKEVTPDLILQIQAWPSTTLKVDETLSRIFGAAPNGPNAVLLRDMTSLCDIAPGRTLILCRDPTIRFRIDSGIDADSAAMTDLSGARTVLRVNGPEVETVLAKGLTIGVAIEDFPVGTSQSSAIHHMDVLLIRRDAETFDLVVHRSFAHDMAEWLLDVGLEFSAVLTLMDRTVAADPSGRAGDDVAATDTAPERPHE